MELIKYNILDIAEVYGMQMGLPSFDFLKIEKIIRLDLAPRVIKHSIIHPKYKLPILEERIRVDELS